MVWDLRRLGSKSSLIRETLAPDVSAGVRGIRIPSLPHDKITLWSHL